MTATRPERPPTRAEAKAGRKRLLVAGVLRGIGRHLCERLRHSFEIVGVDRGPAPRGHDDGVFDFVRRDLRRESMEDLFRDRPFDAIVHLALAQRPQVGRLARERRASNVLGTMRLLELARDHGTGAVVLVSTARVYGASAVAPCFLGEESPLEALDPRYEMADVAETDLWASGFAYRHPEVRTVVLRPTLVVGPHGRDEWRDALHALLVPRALGFDPTVQLLHEDDLVQAIELALARHEARGAYNVAGQETVPLSRVLAASGRPRVPLPLVGARLALGALRRVGLVGLNASSLDFLRHSLVVSDRRARRELGYAPRASLAEALAAVR